MWRWLLVGVGGLLLGACGSDFIREPPPDISIDTSRDVTPIFEQDTGKPDTTKADLPPPCHQNPPANGCVCTYKGIPRGVCKQSVYQGGACKKPAAYQQEESWCDNKDNDCDGEVDENEECKYQCYDGDCKVSSITNEEGTHVGFDFTCPGERDLYIAWPKERAKKKGACWKIWCFKDSEKVTEMWCE